MAFKTGDKVRVLHDTGGKIEDNAEGTVVALLAGFPYPYRVTFPNGDTEVFDKDELELVEDDSDPVILRLSDLPVGVRGSETDATFDGYTFDAVSGPNAYQLAYSKAILAYDYAVKNGLVPEWVDPNAVDENLVTAILHATDIDTESIREILRTGLVVKA